MTALHLRDEGFDLDIFPQFVIFLTNFNSYFLPRRSANKVKIGDFDYPKIEPIDHSIDNGSEEMGKREKYYPECYFKEEGYMETNKVVFNALLALFMGILLCSCANVKFTPHGKTFPPYTGNIKVIWKDRGLAVNPNSYDFIGTVSDSVAWCGIIPANLDDNLHNRLVKEAGKYGGNGIILYCGEIGSVDECKCYGDIIRFK